MNENIELKLTLEELKSYKETPSEVDPLLQQAANTIERLTLENEQLKQESIEDFLDQQKQSNTILKLMRENEELKKQIKRKV